ncbi:ABC transporter substrate-binding protein [Pararhodobacter aggregans]|uniref:ABC transporter substrate-binding protein n=1 Tax=Pararhodobacter aggregans TaxID=404875 RepID=A0A2T7USI9_9RHOB|nr:ABC transporter substrate-binding protein [Pararhodobacter aggregans]PTX03323.1 iron complex transport system substrate-binding protein [Pararhodobacter aggregans]PVE47624.1 ABC transporter substrate-binding protein [Pararhodobacter aggregans]
MSVFARVSEGLAAVLALALWAGAGAAQTAPPARVVSMNLCTDQLALMLAAPGQLISVSYLAHDGAVAPLRDAARALPANHGLAEEIYMLQPDLVLAGRYSTVATVAMLQRLGVPVIRFEPENSLDEIEGALTQMGAALGREAEAEALIAGFRADRTRLAASLRDARAGTEGPRAVLYSARGWTGGSRTLSGDILREAGLRNIADELGLTWGGMVTLESLLMADPDRLILGQPGRSPDGWSEARALLHHPALRHSRAYRAGVAANDRDWVCGTPHVLDAIARLIDETTP